MSPAQEIIAALHPIVTAIAVIILSFGQMKISDRIDRIESQLDQIERLGIDAAAFAPAK